MDITEMRKILRDLGLMDEVDPLVYVFLKGRNGQMEVFSVSRHTGSQMDDEALLRMMREQYPSTREGVVQAVERPDSGLKLAGEDSGNWIDRIDTCQMLHISPRTLERWSKRGVFRKSTLGGRVYYNRSDIDRALRLNLVSEDGKIDKTAVDQMLDGCDNRRH